MRTSESFGMIRMRGDTHSVSQPGDVRCVCVLLPYDYRANTYIRTDWRHTPFDAILWPYIMGWLIRVIGRYLETTKHATKAPTESKRSFFFSRSAFYRIFNRSFTRSTLRERYNAPTTSTCWCSHSHSRSQSHSQFIVCALTYKFMKNARNKKNANKYNTYVSLFTFSVDRHPNATLRTENKL